MLTVLCFLPCKLVYFGVFCIFRYSDSLKHAYKEGLRKTSMASIMGGVIWLTIFGIFSLAFWYGAKLIRDECMEPGALLQVCACTLESLTPCLKVFKSGSYV